MNTVPTIHQHEAPWRLVGGINPRDFDRDKLLPATHQFGVVPDGLETHPLPYLVVW
ncbi:MULTISPECIES: hypothetical protein [unclassified Rhizobium]|uniref:hypothetical protein n=1 Tax=unclassified Rhizobium TaxID=2613769 RepID=UPI00137472A4|nr:MULTISPECIES: hypothetical protein [unclassified Rhizobium]